jgi:hypothetical protein
MAIAYKAALGATNEKAKQCRAVRHRLPSMSCLADLFATAHLVEDGEVVAWDGPDLEMTAELIETQSGRGADR